MSNQMVLINRLKYYAITILCMWTMINIILFIITVEDSRIPDILKGISVFYATVAIGLGSITHIFDVNFKKGVEKSYALNILFLLAISIFGYILSITDGSIAWQRWSIYVGALIVMVLLFSFSFTLWNSILGEHKKIQDRKKR